MSFWFLSLDNRSSTSEGYVAFTDCPDVRYERKRGVKDDTKIFGPNNWQNGTVVNRKGEDSRTFSASSTLHELASIMQTVEGIWVPG